MVVLVLVVMMMVVMGDMASVERELIATVAIDASFDVGTPPASSIAPTPTGASGSR